MPAESSRAELIYVGDPLCSWCWGFAPSLGSLRRDHADRFRFRLIVGGLRAGDSAQPLDDELRGYLGSAWREVEKRSGQPFNHEFLARADFVYDTEPACRAVVTARALEPERVFDYNDALQDAFYRKGLDPTKTATFVDLARELGFPAESFAETFASAEIATTTRDDFAAARELGVHGFPSLLLRQNGKTHPITRGWLPPDALTEALRDWLS